MMYGMCSSGAVNTIFCVEILMYNVSLTHSCLYVYINNACNLMSVHQQLSKDKLLDRLLNEPKLQSL